MATYYVSTEGNDSWSGLYAEPLPDGSDGPLATVEQAQIAMRSSAGADTTYVREGTYALSTPLSLNAADSNSTYAAYGGETVVLTGGTPVTGWVQGSDGVWMAQATGEVGQLVVDGQAQTEARYPNFQTSDPIRGGWLWADELPGGYDPTQALAFDPGDFAPGQLAPGMTVTVFDESGYSSEVLTIATVDAAAGVMTFVESSEYELGTTSRYFVSGGEVHLDQPGEWWYEEATQTLYYKAPAGFDGSGAVVSDEQTLVSITNAQNVRIEGFVFSDTTASNDDTPAAAIKVNNSSNVVITRNEFVNVGKGVFLDNDSHHNTVSSNSFSHIWSKAIELNAGTHENVVTNNFISHSGEVFATSGAISLQETWGNTISHNTIQDVPRFGIQEVNWDPGQKSGGNIIEYNEILRSGQQTSDVAAIYTVANLDPNHLGDTIRYNRIVDTGGLTATDNGFVAGDDFSAGIYLDDFSSNAKIYGNFISGTSFGGIFLHGGDNIEVYNNILVDGGFAQLHFVELDGEAMTGIDVHDNIIGVIGSGENTVDLDPDYVGPASVHDNIYYSPGGALPRLADVGFAAWQALGGDLGSIVTPDPGFTNPAGGDFSLKPGSLAASLGFVDLPWDDIGASLPSVPASIVGGSENDVLAGTAAADDMRGLAGNDTLIGAAGNDRLDGGAGLDTAAYDEKTEGINVRLAGASNAPVWVGGIVEDTINSIENIRGSSDGDQLTGDSLGNSLYGAGGDDHLSGGPGIDILDGGDGSDLADYRETSADMLVTLSLSADATVMVGGVAEDTIRNIEKIFAGSGNDILTGDAENNLFLGGAGIDILDGGAGRDSADYRDKTDSVIVTLEEPGDATVTVGGIVEDAIRNIENVFGGSASDTLTGDANDNYFIGGAGNDALDGGAGSDTAEYDGVTGSVVVTLNGSNGATVFVAGIAEDTLRLIENVNGGASGDSLTGDSEQNILCGRDGDDRLGGGSGLDQLCGGAGADTFVFDEIAPLNHDRIQDYSADDVIELDGDAFTALAGGGTLAFEAFYTADGATSAHDADDRIIYNPLSGQLYYDADGNQPDGASAVLFAVVDPGTALTNSDLLVA